MNNKFAQYFSIAAFTSFLALSPTESEAKKPKAAPKEPTPEDIYKKKCEGQLPEREAFLVVDAKTDATLMEQDSKATGEVASLTKLMTILLAYEAIQDGVLDENKVVKIDNAWNRLRNGLPITKYVTGWKQSTIGNLIAAAAIESRNDAAVALAVEVAKARKIGDTEADFVRFMNERAKAIKLVDSNFHNATGLPLKWRNLLTDNSENQGSSMQNIVGLYRYIDEKYPKLMELFHLPEMKVQNQTVFSTNTFLNPKKGLKSKYPSFSVFGKTGYTCKVGFAMAAVGEYAGQKVFFAYKGALSPRHRHERIEDILKQAFLRQSLLNPVLPIQEKPLLPDDVTIRLYPEYE